MRAKIVKSELKLAIDEIECIREAKMGTVKLGAGPSILSSFIADLAMLLTEKRPDIELKTSIGAGGISTVDVLDGLWPTVRRRYKNKYRNI